MRQEKIKRNPVLIKKPRQDCGKQIFFPKYITCFAYIPVSILFFVFSNYCCHFRPCRATYLTVFVLSQRKWGCKYHRHYVEKATVVSSASASVQENHGLNFEGTKRLFSASGVVKEGGFITSYMDHTYKFCRTAFQNDDICTAAELISGVSRGCSKHFAERLLKFLCKMRPISANLKDWLHSLEASQKALSGKITKTIFFMNTELRTLSSIKTSEKKE